MNNVSLLRMEMTITGLVLIAALPSKSVQAQDFCASIQHLLISAKGQFTDLKGQATGGKEWKAYNSTLTLPNAKECEVATKEGSSAQFNCIWIVDTPKKGLDEYTTLVAGVKKCLTKMEVVSRDRSDDKETGFYSEEPPISMEISFSRNSLELEFSLVAP
jgi:hypothetical protein